MEAKQNPVIKILRSYLLLILMCGVTICILSKCSIPSEGSGVANGDDFILYTAKLIKLCSFIFIFLGLMGWMYELPDSDQHRNKHYRWGVSVAIITGLISVYLLVSVTHYTMHTKILNIGYLADNFLSLLPILAAALANWSLMKAGDGVVYVSFRRFFYIVYFPILVASVTILGMAAYLDTVVHITNLPAMVSGAMAFLVFVTHCTERVVAEMENLPLQNVTS